MKGAQTKNKYSCRTLLFSEFRPLSSSYNNHPLPFRAFMATIFSSLPPLHFSHLLHFLLPASSLSLTVSPCASPAFLTQWAQARPGVPKMYWGNHDGCGKRVISITGMATARLELVSHPHIWYHIVQIWFGLCRCCYIVVH